jgi:hypothetical protein
MRDRWLPADLRRLEQAIGEVDSLLEVGCGDRSPIRWFRRRAPYAVGVDLHAPSIEHSRRLGIHDGYEQLDVLEIADHFDGASFDAVIALDLIEHLTPADGERLLDAMERVARTRIVILTPNGFLEQGEYGGNPWQVHRSGWTPADLAARGYRVHGMSGLKWLRGEYATPRWRPHWLWERVARCSQPLVWRRPAAAFHLLAVKELPALTPASTPTPATTRLPSS